MIAERLLRELQSLERMGYAVRVTAVYFDMSGDEGASGAHGVYMSEKSLLKNDEDEVAAIRGKFAIVK